MGNSDVIDGTRSVAVGDVSSLLRCAPRSGAVIICGELSGMSAHAVERLVRQRAPQARLIRADRAIEITGSARRRGRRSLLARFVRPAPASR
jgi:hypothetical protein